jgi:hypothetical protein
MLCARRCVLPGAYLFLPALFGTSLAHSIISFALTRFIRLRLAAAHKHEGKAADANAWGEPHQEPRSIEQRIEVVPGRIEAPRRVEHSRRISL